MSNIFCNSPNILKCLDPRCWLSTPCTFVNNCMKRIINNNILYYQCSCDFRDENDIQVIMKPNCSIKDTDCNPTHYPTQLPTHLPSYSPTHSPTHFITEISDSSKLNDEMIYYYGGGGFLFLLVVFSIFFRKKIKEFCCSNSQDTEDD